MKKILKPLAIIAAIALTTAASHAAAVFERFESYPPGSNLHGQGSWAGWADDPAAGAFVSTSVSASPTQSLLIQGASDLVRTFSGVTNGQWVLKVLQYIPSSSKGSSHFILLNTYRKPYGDADLNWSVQIQANMDTSQVISDIGGGSLPMVKDQWVEIRCEIDLINNTVSEYYNGRLLSTHQWHDSSGAGGLSELQAVDFFANNAGPVHYDNLSLAPQGLVIEIDLGRKSQGCTGFGICRVFIDPFNATRPVPATAEWLDDRLRLNFLVPPPGKEPFLTIDEDIELESRIAQSLGHEQVIIKAGQYLVDYSKNPNGEVSVNAAAHRPIIWIKIGLPKAGGCVPGFGICSIGVGPAPLDSVTAAARLGDGQLQLSFLGEPPGKTNVLTLEQDLVLDGEAAHALGAERIILKAGQYPLDFSANPHGVVTIAALRFGIIITIETGRGTNCQGFGICSITVETTFSLRSVRTLATWEQGRLVLNYLADPPDKADILVIDHDVTLDGEIARALGFEELTLRAGQYPVDYSSNPHGEVSPDVIARGIIIRVEVGLRSLQCKGFGICSITIEPTLSLRSVPTAAGWTNGRLLLDFLSMPPDKGDVLTIDEDIVLDDATARALGYEHLTVRKGQYPVDYSKNPNGQVSPDVVARGIVITIHIGRPSDSCRGFGFCGITIETSLSARAVPTAASWSSGRLLLDFLSMPPDKTNVLVVDQDIELDGPTARALGYEHITVRKGQYAVDYSQNPNGQVSPDVAARGIVITIEVGRRSLGCTGFGICSITIDASLSARAVPTAASWSNGRLLLDFLSMPPDKTNVLVIDQDIELDGPTARALGYEHITVRKGQYLVDYSKNPYGQVSPDVAARGIVITIEVGRRSLDCTKFGICSITIDVSLSARAVPTAASWSNGRLLLDFLSMPPDKTNVLAIDQDIELDGPTARALGYEHITVRKGQYLVDYSKNPYGQVSPDVAARGIVITIEVGRRSLGCTGFGICSITIDVSLSARAVPTAASWSNGRLLLDFLSMPPDKTNVLVVDQDIELDGPTARALGYEHITVRKGQYLVDYSQNPNGQVSPDVIARGIVITVEVGRRSLDCTKFGICSITIDVSLSARAVPTAASWSNGRLLLDFLSMPPDKTNVLVIDQDIELDGPTARAFGYEHITVRKGQYAVDYSQNPNGQVSPDVIARGIVITVEVGRRSLDCTKFGICSITIDVSLSARAVPTAASWSNGRLLLDFLSMPPDKTNVLVIDQDIELDGPTARALGYEHITVRKGQYAVDYSQNPNGQVSPDVAARGIVITIHIGRPSDSCRGFGFCGITIETSLSARAVPTAASWSNGRLLLDFLSMPPDKTNMLVVEQDIELDGPTARALGYEHLTVRKGQYPVDYSKNPNGQVSPDVVARGIVITIHIGRPSDSCRGFGFCGITIETSLSARAVPTAASWSNGRLLLDFLSMPPDKTNVLVVEQDIELDGPTARALGYEHLTVRKGQYPVDYSENPNGQVSPDVIARGIVITIEVGRRSLGCTGFGICSITIDVSLSARAVPTAASWSNGRLLLDFLSMPPDKTNVLVVDQDIELDGLTARALGYEHLIVRKGQYPVDYSENPNGQVSPDVIARGIVITIEVGRRSLDCTKFGICSITIDASLSARAVPTAASWSNGRLLLDFLSMPPDKSDILTIDEDIVLDGPTARALGYEHITVRKGQYPVDYSRNPAGQVSPDVVARGIIIHIEVGRSSRGCTGFGICSITIEPTLSERSVLGSAEWVGGHLQLKYLAEPPDKTNVLVIDQNIVLDSKLSRALGQDQITLRAGQYVVEDAGGNGQLSPDTETDRLMMGRGEAGGLRLQWPKNGWTLQESTDVAGPWVDSPVQISPLTVAPTATNKFYRLVAP